MRDRGEAQDNVIHPIPPVYDHDSRVLILGSFPSVKSREAGFFYGHPQNRFWKVLACVFCDEVPDSVPARKELLLRHHVAVWDVIASCSISGSSDSSIRNVVPNDISAILDKADISAIFVNGTTALRLYNKYILPVSGREAVLLPSTSPANAAWSLDKLVREWSKIV